MSADHGGGPPEDDATRRVDAASTGDTGGGGGGGGRWLADRYELLGSLGAGGMADVQRARDHQLDREVAIKILHARYTDDEEFLARFQREARAAANLNQPNIVAVYDYGGDDGRPYIVMELVEGRSLKDVIRSERVAPEAALHIAADAALGLHYAHERGLIHRDIKPANILFSDAGQVKVTDFGIARAVGAETVTQTAAVFGTAAYMAPEQARSEEVDRRTDVYALGCVLYELLTGRPPFTADSPVALAHKHITEAPTPPSTFDSALDENLDAIVLQAMAKDPDDRYASAQDLHDDLQRALEGAPVAALAWAASTQVVASPDATQVTPTGGTGSQPLTEYEYEADEEPRRSRRGLGYVALGIGVVAAVVLIAWLLSTLVSQQTPELVLVPDVTNQEGPDAARMLNDAGLVPQQGDSEPSAEIEVGRVIRTDPPSGEEVEEGSEVSYVLSTGPEETTVPSLAGQPEDEARAALEDAELEVGARSEEASSEVPEGAVIRTRPSGGSEVDIGTEVDYVVSTGRDVITVPEVVGLPEGRAVDDLEGSCDDPPCLSVQVTRAFDPGVAEGLVISQQPEAGTELPPGSSVVITVSQGPEPVPTTEPPPEPTPEPTPEPSPSPEPSGPTTPPETEEPE